MAKILQPIPELEIIEKFLTKRRQALENRIKYRPRHDVMYRN